MNWFDILKNIQISSQRTSSKDYVKPDEDDTTCRKRFEDMLNFIDNVWQSQNNVEKLPVNWPDEIFCKALEYINKHTFLLYNPYGDKDWRERIESVGLTVDEEAALFKYPNAFEFYERDNYRADITHNIGNNHRLKMTYRMVLVDYNTASIFCNILLGELNTTNHYGEVITIGIFENFPITDEDMFDFLSEEPYDDGVDNVSIPKDKEPTYIKRNDWRKF